ncbi:hypothetical protein Tco_0926961 [Tanacetum coccineum]|uniref:Uncharacterized protein n=1 Tax=Tanacetum coccineum TaxID=301880 RepID=A0ABQ5DDX7_9ASTR
MMDTQNWLSDLAKAEKPSKMLNELMSTPINFTAFAMNHLQISDLTKTYLVPNNPEGDRYPFDLNKPLPLVESRNRLIIPADYFFNNDLAYLQGESTNRTYTTSLSKTKASKYDLQEIEDMVSMLWSPIKTAYNIHALLVLVALIWFGLIKDMANNLELWYSNVMPRRRWSNLDKKRSRIMVKDIDRYQNRRDLPRNIPLDRIEVHRYDTKEVKVRKGIMQTKTELTLEQTQQGVSDEVLNIRGILKYSQSRWKSFQIQHQTSFTKDSILQAGNHVKEILLKVNLPDHSDEVLKIKNFKKYDYTSFQDQEKYEHVGPKVTSSQDGKRSQDDDKRLDLADDLKESQVHIQVKLKEQSQA